MCVYIYIRHRASGTQGGWYEPPSSFWICTLRLEVLLELRLNLSENLTDSEKNWLKVNSFSGAGTPEILNMQPLSSETFCFDPRCCCLLEGGSENRLPFYEKRLFFLPAEFSNYCCKRHAEELRGSLRVKTACQNDPRFFNVWLLRSKITTPYFVCFYIVFVACGSFVGKKHRFSDVFMNHAPFFF